LENHPTIADVQYSVTLNDLNPSNPGAGLKAVVLKTLQGLEAPVAATK
jgi:hypothetical protein